MQTQVNEEMTTELVRFLGRDCIEGWVRLNGGESSVIVLKKDGRDVRAVKLMPDKSSRAGLHAFKVALPKEIQNGGFCQLTVELADTGRVIGEILYWRGCDSETASVAPWPVEPSSLEAQRVCLVAPHPDDESFLFGGVALKHRDEGAEVSIVWMTNGELGGDADLRIEEARAAAERLSVREVAFFGFCDGRLAEFEIEAVRRLVDWFEKTQPELVYAPSPNDWHTDHTATARIVSIAATISRVPQLLAFGEYYCPIRPNLIMDISEYAAEKKKLCGLHKSQLTKHDYSGVALGLNAYRGLLLGGAGKYAEAYFVTPVVEGEFPVVNFLRFQADGGRFPALRSANSTFTSARGLSLSPPDKSWPEIDLSALTYESEEDICPFLESLIGQDYPTQKIHLRIRDQSITDDCWPTLEAAVARWGRLFASFNIERGENLGFGAGHNCNFQNGSSELILCSNVDLIYERDAITVAVNEALSAPANVAAWEFRQKPYEHPKIYDPVSLAADWCSAACLLMRRMAFEAVKGFDEVLFLYGEDVDLSYRFRAAGWNLRYCPRAVVIHGADRDPENAVRPQHRHLQYGDFLVRLRFGNRVDRRRGWAGIARGAAIGRHFEIPLKTRWKEWFELAGRALRIIVTSRSHRYPARRSALRLFEEPEVVQQVKQIKKPRLRWAKDREESLSGRFKETTFCFHGVGAGVPLEPMALGWEPLVSIIVRTDGKRKGLLLEALRTLRNQTWRRMEVVVVQDGGDSMESVVAEYEANFESLRFLSIPKSGRSRAGNAGLAAAAGELIGFLDDDDLLFAQHVEMLVSELAKSPECPAAASFAIEIPTVVVCPVTPIYREFGLRNSYQKAFSYHLIWKENLFPIQAVLFRRELYGLHGGFDESLDALEDWDLWIRYCSSGPFATVPKTTSGYRVPADPESAHTRQKQLDDAYAKVYAKHADTRPELTIAQLRGS